MKNNNTMTKYKRILLKLSGESLGNKKEPGINKDKLSDFAQQITEIASLGIQIAIVVGGGNIYRGKSDKCPCQDRIKGDQMGMLATVINGIALCSALQEKGRPTELFTAIRMEPIGQYYNKETAIKSLQENKIIIIAGGTGNPLFTTDTAAVLRSIELEANAMLKGTRVDGIYTEDPEKTTKAMKYNKITYDQVYNKNLKVMDLTAITLAKDNQLPIIVFNIEKPGNLRKILENTDIGTIVIP